MLGSVAGYRLVYQSGPSLVQSALTIYGVFEILFLSDKSFNVYYKVALLLASCSARVEKCLALPERLAASGDASRDGTNEGLLRPGDTLGPSAGSGSDSEQAMGVSEDRLTADRTLLFRRSPSPSVEMDDRRDSASRRALVLVRIRLAAAAREAIFYYFTISFHFDDGGLTCSLLIGVGVHGLSRLMMAHKALGRVS